MKLVISQNTQAAIFSTQQTRNMIWFKPGEYQILDELEDGCDGEKVAIVDLNSDGANAEAIIISTHWGLTPIGKLIKA